MKEYVFEIEGICRELGIAQYIIRETRQETAELFFIRHALDMRRMKKVVKYNVCVYREFEKDGNRMLGSSSVEIVPAQGREDVRRLLERAYFAASFVANPLYALPDKVVSPLKESDSDMAAMSLGDAAMTMAQAMFAGERPQNKAFINSGEIFAEKTVTRILSACGTDVSYASHTCSGEVVVQCKEPEDVEQYRAFAYDSLKTDALTALVSEALQQVEDRAAAEKALPSGSYDVILSGEQLSELLGFFLERTCGNLVFPGYSTWRIGDDIMGKNTTGERLNITGWAKNPYNNEGIPMEDRPLIEDGRVALIHSGAQYASYLKTPMTGLYTAIRVSNGTVPFAEMKKNCLYPVSFSDFQTDAFSGFFGGEIRLAYLYDGETVKIVTGGSVSGNISECMDELVFSIERYSGENYEGPFAVKLKNVRVAGTV